MRKRIERGGKRRQASFKALLDAHTHASGFSTEKSYGSKYVRQAFEYRSGDRILTCSCYRLSVIRRDLRGLKDVANGTRSPFKIRKHKFRPRQEATPRSSEEVNESAVRAAKVPGQILHERVGWMSSGHLFPPLSHFPDVGGQLQTCIQRQHQPREERAYRRADGTRQRLGVSGGEVSQGYG